MATTRESGYGMKPSDIYWFTRETAKQIIERAGMAVSDFRVPLAGEKYLSIQGGINTSQRSFSNLDDTERFRLILIPQ